MSLRLVLLSLVALMSFELPSGRDFNALVGDASRWADARVADLSRLALEVTRSFDGSDPARPTTEPASGREAIVDELALMRADLVFETAMDGLATDFRSDLAATEATLPVAEAAPPLIAAAVPDVKTMVDQPEPVCFDQEIAEVEPLPTGLVAESGPTVDRLSAAVRLTRQALTAWVSLVDGDRQDTR